MEKSGEKIIRPRNPIILVRKDSESCPPEAWTKRHTTPSKTIASLSV
ncbi:hypothetical protein HMPREF1988_01019 [Porphyromonas gingivalis F0185]|nr:hypothetical protein HMPREF1988_01019 [Porphyromonas gingivalis F0185]ERJ86948.1 hypothetical protein HMPREF1989_00904 [Porphyromonas gingivalis F0566]